MVTQSIRAVCAGFSSRKGILASLMMGLMLPVLAGSLACAQGSPLPAAAGTQTAKSATPADPAAGTAAPSAKETTPPAPRNSESEERPAKSGGDAIHVHGHWIIEVKNPDGKVTDRREFENSLQPSGAFVIAALLAGNNSAGGLAIGLNWWCAYSVSGQNPTNPCWPWLITPPPSASGYVNAFLGCNRNGSWNNQAVCVENLQVTGPTLVNEYNPSPIVAMPIVLSGSTTVCAGCSGTVQDVETLIGLCDANSTPFNCWNSWDPTTGQSSPANPIVWGDYPFLTERTLDSQNGDPPPVPYHSGQTIAVTVTLTFQ
ncbi:MAG TPA: hypothetical protein VME23_12900 [Terracidiphilus sp.]|nr:hypothetical protein [Terracidiphilus sp.]